MIVFNCGNLAEFYRLKNLSKKPLPRITKPVKYQIQIDNRKLAILVEKFELIRITVIRKLLDNKIKLPKGSKL